MARALLLNASFEPLCVVSARRAVVSGAQGQSGDRSSQRRRIPLGTAQRSGAQCRPPRPLRAGALSGDGAPVAACSLRPRRASLSVLRCRRREPRPRVAAVARWAAHLGERRRVVSIVQRPQGSPAAERMRDGVAPTSGRTARHHVTDRVGRTNRSGVAQVPRPQRGRLRLIGGVQSSSAGAEPAIRSRSTASSSRARLRSARAFSRISAASRSAFSTCCAASFSAAWRRLAASLSASSRIFCASRSRDLAVLGGFAFGGLALVGRVAFGDGPELGGVLDGPRRGGRTRNRPRCRAVRVRTSQPTPAGAPPSSRRVPRCRRLPCPRTRRARRVRCDSRRVRCACAA